MSTGETSVKKSVYLETTIFSYLVAKPSRDLLLLAHQHITCDWWDTRRADFDLWVSEAVSMEAAGGDPEAARERLAAMKGIRGLPITPAVEALTARLLAKRLLPEKASIDALHVAIASVHLIDYLLTWNCKHLANAELAEPLAVKIQLYGYKCPIICTPETLLGDENDRRSDR